MLTFLPFSSAVKRAAGCLRVCASIARIAFAIAIVSCAAGDAAYTHAGPPTGPLATASSNAPTAGASVADAGSRAIAVNLDAGSASPGPANRAPALSIELPYPLDGRPRASDPLQAAAEDEELARWNTGGSADPGSPSSRASYHPGTRVVVDTRQAKLRAGATRGPTPRGLTLDRVQAQARSRGYWPFRLCFEAGQREKKGTGGETRVAFTIGLRGQVRAARLLDSHLGNAATAACLVRALLKLEFTPRPAKSLALVASIRIWPGDAELPAIPEATAVTSPAGGDFDATAVSARMLERRAELETCFAEAQRTDPQLWGRLALSVILEVDGSVHRVSEVESHFPNAAASRCAQALVSGVLFPSVNGKPFSFVLPLRLSPVQAPDNAAPSPEADPSSAGSDDAGAD